MGIAIQYPRLFRGEEDDHVNLQSRSERRGKVVLLLSSLERAPEVKSRIVLTLNSSEKEAAPGPREKKRTPGPAAFVVASILMVSDGKSRLKNSLAHFPKSPNFASNQG